jgi:hypothetical protein
VDETVGPAAVAVGIVLPDGASEVSTLATAPPPVPEHDTASRAARTTNDAIGAMPWRASRHRLDITTTSADRRAVARTSRP